MSRRRRLHYSASLSVIVTALGVYFEGRGGEFLLLPGIVPELFLELGLSLLLTDGDLYPMPPGSRVVLTAFVFFLSIFIISLGWGHSKEEAGRV